MCFSVGFALSSGFIGDISLYTGSPPSSFFPLWKSDTTFSYNTFVYFFVLWMCAVVRESFTVNIIIDYYDASIYQSHFTTQLSLQFCWKAFNGHVPVIPFAVLIFFWENKWDGKGEREKEPTCFSLRVLPVQTSDCNNSPANISWRKLIGY